MAWEHLEVREATQQDEDALVVLINDAFAIEKGDFKVIDRITHDELRGYRQRGRFLVAMDGGTMLACVFVRTGDPAVSADAGYLGLLSVLPRKQKAGLGAFMTLQAEAWLQQHGCSAVELNILDVRPELRPYYEGLGYRVLRSYPTPYPERFTRPVQFVRMRKVL